MDSIKTKNIIQNWIKMKILRDPMYKNKKDLNSIKNKSELIVYEFKFTI
jgi:hypothetical protein